jgi:hypothetical protein
MEFREEIETHIGVQNQSIFPLIYCYFNGCVLIWIAELDIDENS